MPAKEIKPAKEIEAYQTMSRIEDKLDEYIRGFPRYDRFTTGEYMSSLCRDIMENLLMAYSVPEERYTCLRRCEAKFTLLEHYIKKCNRRKILPLKKIALLAVEQEAFGRQLTGWIMRTREKEHKE